MYSKILHLHFTNAKAIIILLLYYKDIIRITMKMKIECHPVHFLDVHTLPISFSLGIHNGLYHLFSAKRALT